MGSARSITWVGCNLFANAPVCYGSVAEAGSMCRVFPTVSFTRFELKPADHVMSNQQTDLPSSFRPSINTDELRPALLLAGTQVLVALLGAVLLTNGALS